MVRLEQGPSSVIWYHFSVPAICKAAICQRLNVGKGDSTRTQGLRRLANDGTISNQVSVGDVVVVIVVVVVTAPMAC
jgi:hypothetical protein